jgi:DUF177 domain-containing protein
MSTVVDVRDLVDSPGSSRPVRMDEAIAGLATQVALVPEDRLVGGTLLLESVTDGILVSGRVSGVMTLACARCLKSFDRAFDLEVQELFVPGAQPDDDEYPLNDGHLDLEPMIRDVVMLSMPFAPACRPDCRGLCPRCGGDRNLGECTCTAEVDPRWAPLSDLRLTD